MDPLAGIVAKLDRGFEHLEEVEPKIGPFLEDKPWRIAIEEDPEPPDALPGWRLAIFKVEREPPLDWSIAVGEAVGQFASSLDHLMTELVILRRPQFAKHPDRTPNFPIYPRPGEFWRVPTDGGRVPRDACNRWVRPEHLAELEWLQPRQPEDVGGMHPALPIALSLHALRTLNNLHKHATVRPAFISPTSVDIRAHPYELEYREIYDPLRPLHDKTQLYRARFQPHPDVGMPMGIEPDISFGWPPFEHVPIEYIRLAGEHVRQIIDRFRSITPEFKV